ncbi:helix-turn-helix transcriptional regulator [Aureitalea sp. L0-47]|uniref:helix-turn-helix domain-containing protein n=1 Tax=Aureitalea sp. L0-47 TaxID=2816962 RepID=UPI002237B7AB|nr:response regulator transcription factor [Aureitalea sp. L0-47]MCW5518904.1 helix-turn-helix transcriptional regulator [Aureitalea sp. L0-47]
MENFMTIDSVSTYFKLRNYELLHPLIGILDFDKFEPSSVSPPTYSGFTFECYAIFLKDHNSCKMKYGGKHYDFDEGTMVFLSPQQSVGFVYEKNHVPKGYALLFHPDLLHGTKLGKKIQSYSFFSYAVNEALHISMKERRIILDLLEKIQFELEQNMDGHSKNLIVSNLELLLDYCVRFYDRQFLTREVAHSTSLERFDVLLNEYFLSEEPNKQGLPSVTYFAEQLHLSPNYFGDLIKKETGRSAQEYIQNKLIEVAKEKVFDHEKSISEIAYELGFRYPQHFSRLFKNKTGLSPNDFRNMN